MSTTADKILYDALNLSPAERAALVEELLSSLDKPEPEIDELWAKEAEASATAAAAAAADRSSLLVGNRLGESS